MPSSSPNATIGDRPALARGAGQHVLIVAGEPDLAELLSTTLELAGYRISLVGTGTEAMARAFERRYDLVVLDSAVPDLAGLGRERRPPPTWPHPTSTCVWVWPPRDSNSTRAPCSWPTVPKCRTTG